MANYLVHHGHDFLRNKSIVELGSGTGLVGLVAGKLGAVDVCITDQAFVVSGSLWFSMILIEKENLWSSLFSSPYRPLLPLMEENVALNGLSGLVSVAELNWFVCFLRSSYLLTT